jgi:hypothetical protein
VNSSNWGWRGIAAGLAGYTTCRLRSGDRHGPPIISPSWRPTLAWLKRAFWRCRAFRIILLKSPQSPHGPVASIGDENASCAPAYIREGERHEAPV